MMLGGVGFQAGLDEARRKARPPAPAPRNAVTQIQQLQALLDDDVITPSEFERAKRKVLER
jgi:hypothetical protein